MGQNSKFTRDCVFVKKIFASGQTQEYIYPYVNILRCVFAFACAIYLPRVKFAHRSIFTRVYFWCMRIGLYILTHTKNHVCRSGVILAFHPTSHNNNKSLTYRLPMSVTDTRVTNGMKYWQMLLEFVNFTLHTICDTPRTRLVVERLCQLVHAAPHVANFVLYLFSI